MRKLIPFAVVPRWRRFLCNEFAGFLLTWFLGFYALQIKDSWIVLLVVPFWALMLGFNKLWGRRIEAARKERRKQGIW